MPNSNSERSEDKKEGKMSDLELELEIRARYLEDLFGTWTEDEIRQTREDIDRSNEEIRVIRDEVFA